MKYKLNFLPGIIFLLVLSFFCKGQIAVGQWRDHLPYHEGEMIVKAKDKVYMVSASGMFSYNIKTGEINRFSKVTGLSDYGVKSINYHENLDILFIGYRNGNIDLISGNQIYNVSDIKRKSMTGDKTIYNAIFIGDFAYLACGFGIVELNLVRREIRNTFFIGDLGSSLKVNQLSFDGQYIYAATDEGIYRGDIDKFLVDFSNWEQITNINTGPFAWTKNKKFENITYFNGNIFVNYKNDQQSNSDTILIFDGYEFSHFDPGLNRIESIVSNDDYLVIVSTSFLRIYNKDIERLVHFGIYYMNGAEVSSFPRHAYVTNDQELWIADRFIGMVHFRRDWVSVNYAVNAPGSYKIFSLKSAGNVVYGVGGGVDLSWNPTWTHSKLYRFADQRWETFRTPDYRDLVSLAINPKDHNTVFAGSWINGVLEYHKGQVVNVYDDSNSTINHVDGYSYYRIGGLAYDKAGNLWLSNADTEPTFSVMDKNGNWTGVDYSTIIGKMILGDIIVTKDNIKWVILPRGNGLFVFDDNGTPGNMSDDRYKLLSVRNESGELISNNIFSIAEDKNGYIWVGTNKGVAVYYNPQDVFDNPNFHARQILIPRRDGTDNADILLATETVTAIEVDGANRKWFGTSSAGVFYTSPDGIEQIHNFNTDNSPLIDNSILSITVNPTSGEVFFGTSSGIMSYRATATEGSEDYEKVYAFPNPVRHDYRGPITITGLVAGSYVKITDVSGNLVYEMRSEGGQAIWYGNNLSGNRVQTGVYLVFSTNEDGSKTDVTKILFIN